jgi:tetratricopeptide (TPR) repeat protein
MCRGGEVLGAASMTSIQNLVAGACLAIMASLAHADAQPLTVGGDAPSPIAPRPVAPAAPATPSSSDLVTQCMNDPKKFTPEVMIAACNTLIQSGKWTGKDAAWLYNNIGKGYFLEGDYQDALTNYDHALRLDPGDAYAYCGRGITKDNITSGSGDADIARARKLNPSLCND